MHSRKKNYVAICGGSISKMPGLEGWLATKINKVTHHCDPGISQSENGLGL
jgi:hypothetical protein